MINLEIETGENRECNRLDNYKKENLGVINMSINGSNALKIEEKNEEKKGGFQIKINKFDIYFGIKKNEEREQEINERKIRSIQNLKAVEADREKHIVKYLGDL